MLSKTPAAFNPVIPKTVLPSRSSRPVKGMNEQGGKLRLGPWKLLQDGITFHGVAVINRGLGEPSGPGPHPDLAPTLPEETPDGRRAHAPWRFTHLLWRPP